MRTTLASLASAGTVFLLVRLLYFLIGFAGFALTAGLMLFYGSRRYPLGIHGDAMDLPMFYVLKPEFWMAAAAAGLLAMLVGPGLYHRYTMRGRGELAAIKQTSRMRDN